MPGRGVLCTFAVVPAPTAVEFTLRAPNCRRSQSRRYLPRPVALRDRQQSGVTVTLGVASLHLCRSTAAADARRAVTSNPSAATLAPKRSARFRLAKPSLTLNHRNFCHFGPPLAPRREGLCPKCGQIRQNRASPTLCLSRWITTVQVATEGGCTRFEAECCHCCHYGLVGDVLVRVTYQGGPQNWVTSLVGRPHINPVKGDRSRRWELTLGPR